MPAQTALIDPRSFAAGAAAVLVLSLALAALRPQWVVRFARTVLGLLLLVSLAALAALVQLDPPGLRLAIDPSTEPLLPAGDPAQELYRQAVRDFGDDEVFVIAMETDALFRAERLEQLRRVTDRIARLPGVRRVQSLTDVTSFRYDAEEDWVEVRPFLEEIPTGAARLAELRRRALGDPLYRQTVLSEDARTAAINVSFRKMSDREFIESGLDGAIQAILDSEVTRGVRFHVAGRPHVKARVYQRMLRDLRRLVPGAIAAMALVLGLVFGTRRGVVLPLGTVLTATLWTFGAMALLDRPLTVLTTLLAPTLIAVGGVYGVHVLARYEEEASAAGSSREAAGAALQHLRLPVLIAGGTTMVGFGALCTSDVPAVFELGAFSVLGVASVTLVSVTGLPAVLALAPLRGPGPSQARARWAASTRLKGLLDRLLAKLGRVSTGRARLLRIAWSGLALGAVVAIPRIVIDTDYLSFFDQGSRVRQEFEAVNRLLAGAVPLYVVLRSPQAGSFREPEVLRALEGLQQRIEALPDVSRTLSMVDTVRVLNRTLARGDPAQERIPDTRGAVAELLFLAPKGHLHRYTNVNHSRANLIVRTGAVGTAAVQALEGRLQALLADTAFPPPVRAALTGNALLLARSADGIARGQPRTVGLAAAAILVLIALGLGSWRLGAVAMVPNLIPVLLFFGLLGLGVAPLSLPTSLIGSVALGIAIDDTVHFLVRYRQERAAGRSPEEAAILSTRRVGRPIVVTSIMLLAGFGVVALSGFATLRQFGALSAVTMAVCLATDLLLLPALLVRTRA